MGGNKINQSSRSANQTPLLEDDGGALAGHTSRENVAVIFFRRVGRAFADFGGMISRAFSNLGESFRGAFAHVSNAIRGADSAAALRNVNNGSRNQSNYLGRYGDLDTDDESDAEDLIVDDRFGKESLTGNEDKVPHDFSEDISPAVSQTPVGQPLSPEKNEHESMLNSPLNDNDSKVDIEVSSDEIAAPKKTSGEILFNSFHELDAGKKSIEFLSLGSVYMQRDCLEFAQAIFNRTMAIESGANKEFTRTMLDSANALLKLKRQFDSDEQKRIKKEEFLKQQEIIGKEKSSMRPGEWDFEEFFTEFVTHQSKREKFTLFENGKYRTKPELLTFAEQVESDVNEGEKRKQAATYLIRWSRYPSHAEKITDEAIGFSLVTLPPPPPAPPRRTVAAPKVEPVPVAPEQLAIIRLINADSRHQEQLRTLIGLSSSIMQSGLAALARIWQSDGSSSSKHPSPVQPQMRTVTADDESYTDLEEIDNAIKLITALANMNTSHSFYLSDDVEKIKVNNKSIIQNLMHQRSQIVGSRNISDMADLAANLIVTGQQRFEDFQRAYINSSKRGLLGELKFRDIYFSDECMSYANYTHKKFSAEVKLVGADPDALMAAEYLLKKYNQFKLLSSAENTAAA
jgi:hypothetical protein